MCREARLAAEQRALHQVSRRQILMHLGSGRQRLHRLRYRETSHKNGSYAY
jgi:hypothetical protein